MIKEAIEKILSLAPADIREIGAEQYSNQPLELIKPPEFYQPDILALSSLQGIVTYIEEDKDSLKKEDLSLVVNSPSSVSLCGIVNPLNRNQRFCYAEAKLMGENYPFAPATSHNSYWFDLETFIISLQSMFIESETINIIVGHLAKMANEIIVGNTDDGLSQSIQVKDGLTTLAEVKIENPVTLQPYRTFREVDQPESNCILRLRKRQGIECALFVSDGDAWKLEAVKNIKEWLEKEIKDVPVIA